MAHTVFKRIGLTGGIGSGKSTMAGLLKQRGWDVIDADALSRQLTAPHGAAMPEIQRLFGDQFVAEDGSLQRERMRELVFKQPQAKLQLQSLLHPMVLDLINASEIQIKREGKPLVVLDIPLLVESVHWRQKLDRVLVIDCSAETQIRRVTKRSHLAPALVKQIMETQASRAQRLSAADWVVFNDSDNLQYLADCADNIQLYF
jgi:dephospho-CoA kinase